MTVFERVLTVHAGFALAVVDAVLTALACELGLADTAEVADHVDALARVLAGVSGTLVDVDVTVLSGPALLAHTLKVEETVDADAVEAGLRRAQVHFRLAPLAGEAARTCTGEVVDEVGAVGAKQTWQLRAVVDVRLA